MRDPTQGETVLFILADGQTRPAEVIQAYPGQRATVIVTLDPFNDCVPFSLFGRPDLVPPGAVALSTGMLAAGSVSRDPTGQTPGTYRFTDD